MRDIRGQKFGSLTALSPVKVSGRSNISWLCECDCGKQTTVIGTNLTRGNTQSCGCLKIKRIKKANTRHGFFGTKFYFTYHRMRNRCQNTNYPEYYLYGGRGIKFLWKSFEEFKEHMYASFLVHESEYGGRNTSIDRIDNDGHYSKENCRWATSKQQAMNRSTNVVKKSHTIAGA